MDEACSKDCITVCENRIPVSIARGVSLFNSSIDRVYEDVFAKADHAMYMHKDQCKQKL
jgi:GGDEF domain-containing protein